MAQRSKNSGFITLPLTAWAAVGAFAVIAALGIALKVQSSRLEAAKAEFAAFVAQTQAIGEAQEAKTRQTEEENAKRKQQADAQNSRDRRNLDSIYAAYRSLRDSRSSGSILPEAPRSAGSTDRACFDRQAIDHALRSFDQGITGLLGEGDAAITDLNTAKTWALAR